MLAGKVCKEKFFLQKDQAGNLDETTRIRWPNLLETERRFAQRLPEIRHSAGQNIWSIVRAEGAAWRTIAGEQPGLFDCRKTV